MKRRCPDRNKTWCDTHTVTHYIVSKTGQADLHSWGLSHRKPRKVFRNWYPFSINKDWYINSLIFIWMKKFRSRRRTRIMAYMLTSATSVQNFADSFHTPEKVNKFWHREKLVSMEWPFFFVCWLVFCFEIEFLCFDFWVLCLCILLVLWNQNIPDKLPWAWMNVVAGIHYMEMGS